MDKDFEVELRQLINKYSIDARLGISDAVLAHYLAKCLETLFYTIKNADWKIKDT